METYEFSNIPLENCEGVLIDLDDTLYSYDERHSFAIEKVHSDLFTHFSKDIFLKKYRDARNLVTNRLAPQGPCRSRLLAFLHMYEIDDVIASYQRAYEADALYWDSFIQDMRLAPEADLFLTRCANANIPVCVVSDMTTHIQIRKLEKLGLLEKIQYLVTSEEVGAEKPDPKMFLAGMEKLGIITPSKTLMIGDSYSKDILGAECLGIPAYLISVKSK